MIIVFYEVNLKTSEKMIAVLGQMGLESYPVNKLSNIIPTLRKVGKNIFLCDYQLDREDKDPIENIFKEIRSDQFLKHNPILIHSQLELASKNIFSLLTEYGINGLITRPFRDQSFRTQIETYVEKYKDGGGKRQHIRVTPNKKDNVDLAHLDPKAPQKCFGKIINISKTGIGLGVLDDSDCEEYSVGEVLSKCILKLNDKTIHVDLQVMFKNNEIFCASIIKIAEKDKEVLNAYIFDRF